MMVDTAVRHNKIRNRNKNPPIGAAIVIVFSCDTSTQNVNNHSIRFEHNNINFSKSLIKSNEGMCDHIMHETTQNVVFLCELADLF